MVGAALDRRRRLHLLYRLDANRARRGGTCGPTSHRCVARAWRKKSGDRLCATPTSRARHRGSRSARSPTPGKCASTSSASTCIATVYDEFVAALVKRSRARDDRANLRLRGGDGLPGLRRSAGAGRGSRGRCVEKGARVLVGGRARPDIGPLVYEPTVLEGVTPDMDLHRRGDLRPGALGLSASTPTTRRSEAPMLDLRAQRQHVESRRRAREKHRARVMCGRST